ncbi:MAG: hypothetical protein NC320_04795 [Clostridium sp.]|nr:hypothetical protein [Clostridium sp.]MCM1546769.1 hypothetical protein [Ruminococcus sp.]
MARRQIIFTIIAAMALSTAIIIVSMAYSLKNRRAEAYKQNLESMQTETQPEIGYTLREYEGEIAVFRGESETPYRRLGVYTSVMSDQDRELLKSGIFVKTESELKRLIEDYTS